MKRILLLGLSLFLAVPVAAQIRYLPEDTLGSVDDPRAPGATAEARRLGDGMVAVVSPAAGPTVLRYSPSGRLLDSTGAVEFRSLPVLAYGQHGAVVAADLRAGQIFDVTVEGIEPISSVAATGGRSAALLPDGRLVVSSPREAMGRFHVLGADGAIERSFGTVPESANPMGAHARVATGPDGTIWTMGLLSTHLEGYDSNGILMHDLFVEVPTLTDDAPPRVDPTQAPPPGQVLDLAVDEGGNIWVFVAVADSEWAPPAPGEALRADALFDTVIQVYHPGGEKLADQRFDEIIRPLGDGWGYDLVAVTDGTERVRVGRLQM